MPRDTKHWQDFSTMRLLNNTLTARLLLLSLFLPLILFSQDLRSSFEEQINTTFIGVDPKVEEHIQEIGKRIESRDFTGAARLIHGVLEGDYNGLVPQGKNSYSNVKDYCESLLSGGNHALLEKYRELVDARASELEKSGSPENAIRLAETFALSTKGYSYLFKAGNVLFEMGLFSASLRMYTKAVTYFPDRDHAALLPSGYAASRLSANTSASEFWGKLLVDYAKPVSAGGRMVAPEDFIASFGDLSVRKTVFPEAPEALIPVWTVDTADRYVPGLVQGSRCLAFDRKAEQLTALSLATGLPVWDGGIPLAERETDGLFSCGMDMFGVVIQKTPSPVLFSRGGGVSGKIRMYRLDNGALSDELTLDNTKAVYIDPDPVCLDGKLYFGYQAFEKTGGTPEVFTACYDILQKKFLWNTFICQGQGGASGNISVRDSLVVYLTNKGVVAGVDRYSGRAIWAFRYPTGTATARAYSGRPSGMILAGGDMFYSYPADAEIIHAFDSSGKLYLSKIMRGSLSLGIINRELLIAYGSRIQLYSPEKGFGESWVSGNGVQLFPGGDSWLFYGHTGVFGTLGSDGKLKELGLFPSGETVSGVSYTGKFALVHAGALVYGYVSPRYQDSLAAGDPLRDLLAAQTAFQRKAWEHGENSMNLFFTRAGDSYIYDNADLVPQAGNILGHARIGRGKFLYAQKKYSEAAEWFRKAGEVSTEPEALFYTGYRLADSLSMAEQWEPCVTAARVLIEKYADRKILTDSGVRLTAGEYGTSLIRHAIKTAGPEVYRPFEEKAAALFEKGNYETVISSYKNSSFFVRSLKARAGQLDEAGRTFEALSYIQQYAAYKPDDSAGLELLQQRYLKLDMKGAAEELSPGARAMPEDPVPVRFPLYSTWVVQFDKKVRSDRNINPMATYLTHDDSAVYYEHGGDLEKRDLASGKRIWRYTPGYGWLGITLGDWGNSAGIEIRGVFDGMPAERNGFQTGDIITKINGEPFDGMSGFIRIVKQTVPGEEIDFTFIRGGETREKKVPVGRRPDEYMYNDISSMHLYRQYGVIQRGFRIECVDTLTGKQIWKEDGHGFNRTAFNGGTFCAVTDRGISYFDTVSGKKIWENDTVKGRFWVPVFSRERYIIVYKLNMEDQLHVIDRYTGRHLYSLDLRPLDLLASEEGFLVYGIDGAVAMYDYKTGTELWKNRLPFKPGGSRSVYLGRTGDSYTIWVLRSGGAVFKEGKLVRSYVTEEDRKVQAVLFSGHRFVAIAGETVRIINPDGTERDISYNEPFGGYPKQLERMGEDHVSVMYSFLHKTRIAILDLKDGKHADTVEISGNIRTVFTTSNGLYTLDPAGMEGFSYISDADALNVIERCSGEKTAEAALRGAKIALKMNIPEKGLSLLKPYSGETGETGEQVQNLILDLRRAAFRLSPVRVTVKEGSETEAVLSGAGMFQPSRAKIRAGKQEILEGDKDLSGIIHFSYTREHFIVRLNIRDDIHVQAPSPDRLPEGDAVFVTVDIPILKPKVKQMGRYKNRFIFLIGLSGNKAVLRGVPPVTSRTVLEGTAKAGEREFTLSIPWSELTVHGNKLPFCQVGILLQDNDGKGVEGEMNWTPASIPDSRSFSGKFLNEYMGTVVFE